jgi:peptidyl-prolyl cis-trans isomerase NIMA-interacting 4
MTRARSGLEAYSSDSVLIVFQGKGGLKAATAVNVRHILCEKHSKATEALQKIQVRLVDPV